MTLFGPDVSNNNFTSNSQCLAWLQQLPGEGFAWVEQKVSEGNYYQDPFWPVIRDWCVQNNFLCIGYHYVTTNDPASQVQTYLNAGGTPNVMLDFEQNSGDINNYWAVVNAFNAAGITVRLPYIPRWYWQQIGEPDLSAITGLISSAYDERGQYASTEYDESGGDNGNGWQPYGGATPAIWQFTDSAIVAGLSVDCNAFKGTVSELAALLGAAAPPPPPPPGVFDMLNAQQQQDLYNWTLFVMQQNCGLFQPPVPMLLLPGCAPTQLPPGGWGQLGINADGQNLTPVDALSVTTQAENSIGSFVAAIKKKLDA